MISVSPLAGETVTIPPFFFFFSSTSSLVLDAECRRVHEHTPSCPDFLYAVGSVKVALRAACTGDHSDGWWLHVAGMYRGQQLR